MSYQPLSITTVGGGVMGERFDEAMRQVLDNIADPTTPAEATRKVTLTVTVKPDETREAAEIHVDVTAKTASPKTAKSWMHITISDDGPRATVSNPHQLTLEEQLRQAKEREA